MANEITSIAKEQLSTSLHVIINECNYVLQLNYDFMEYMMRMHAHEFLSGIPSHELRKKDAVTTLYSMIGSMNLSLVASNSHSHSDIL